MGLLTGLLTLPLAPVRGVVWLAGQIEQEAQRQWSDPADVRARIEHAEEAYCRGEITVAERDALQDALVARLLAGAAHERSAGHG